MINSNEGQGKAPIREQETPAEQSPSEKLQNEPPVGSPIPGAENPDSEEIKREINPNTE